MPSALSIDTIVKKAKEYLREKDGYSVTRVSRRRFVNVSSKFIYVRCEECGTETLRNLAWAKSSYDCLCRKGKKIRNTARMTLEEFSEKFDLANRMLKLHSYEGQNAYADVECLSCGKRWSAFPGNLRSHGCSVCAVKEMSRACFEKHGVYNHGARPEVVRRRKRTMLRRYGVAYALQHRKFFRKMVDSSYGVYKIRVGKRKVEVQGYERHAVAYLLSKGVSPTNLVFLQDEELPVISYTYRGRTHTYYPDIYIKNINMIVEVKSTYTYFVNEKVNKIKRKACLDAGYRFKFLVFNKDGSRNRDYKKSNNKRS